MFTLCPRGVNAETRRVYEALEAGSIPIVEAAGGDVDDGAPGVGTAAHCADSLRPLKESGAPVIFVRSWASLPALLERETADRARLNRRQAALLSWYAGFKTKTVDAFERALERAKTGGGVGGSGSTVTGDALAVDDDDDEGAVGVRSHGGSAVPEAAETDQRLEPFLVTGTARSGGPGIAAVMRRAGIDARHGGIGRHGAVSWAHAFHNQSIDVPFEMAEDRVRRMAPSFAFSPVVHIVRHPLDVVGDLYRCFCRPDNSSARSDAAYERQAWRFVERHFPSIIQRSSFRAGGERRGKSGRRLVRAAYYWLLWNTYVGRIADARLRVEDMRLDALAWAIGRSGEGVGARMTSAAHANKASCGMA